MRLRDLLKNGFGETGRSRSSWTPSHPTTCATRPRSNQRPPDVAPSASSMKSTRVAVATRHVRAHYTPIRVDGSSSREQRTVSKSRHLADEGRGRLHSKTMNSTLDHGTPFRQNTREPCLEKGRPPAQDTLIYSEGISAKTASGQPPSVSHERLRTQGNQVYCSKSGRYPS